MGHLAFVSGLSQVAALLQLVAIASGMLAGAVGAAIWLKLWRYAVAVSYAASVMRSGAAAHVLPATVWYVVQFGPLAMAAIPLLTRKSAPMRPIDVGILACMALFAACALVTVLTGLFRSQSLAQSGLLVLMFGFLALTVSRRWLTSAVILGDLTLGFAMVSSAQLVGLAGMVMHQSWAIADYGRFEGAFSNANYAGATSAIGMMIGIYVFRSLTGNRLWWAVVGMVALGAALLLSGSRGALFALAVGVISLVRFRGNRRMLLFAFVGVVLCAIALTVMSYALPSLGGAFNRALQGSDITSGRLQIYEELLGRWRHMPWFGTGYRTSELLTGPNRLTGHNTYVSVLTETGIVGAAVFAVLLVLILRAGRPLRVHRTLLGAVVTILVIEITESFLFGWGSPIPLFEWLSLLAFAALGRATVAAVASARGSELEVSSRMYSGRDEIVAG
jgi:O-antigen ligase